MIKTIIFDFDGTLADSFKVALECANAIGKDLGFREVKDTPELHDKDFKKIIKEDFKVPLVKLRKYSSNVKICLNENSSQIKLFKYLKPVLLKLHNKVDLGIMTSNSNSLVSTIIKREGLDIFNFVYSDTSIFGKTRVLKRLLREHNLEKEEVLYVGDEIRDIKACKKIGVKIASVTWGYNSKKSLKKENPNYLIDKPSDILKILEKRLTRTKKH